MKIQTAWVYIIVFLMVTAVRAQELEVRNVRFENGFRSLRIPSRIAASTNNSATRNTASNRCSDNEIKTGRMR